MTRSIRHTPPLGNVNVAFLMERQIGDGIVGVDLDGAEDLMDGLRRVFSY